MIHKYGKVNIFKRDKLSDFLKSLREPMHSSSMSHRFNSLSDTDHNVKIASSFKQIIVCEINFTILIIGRVIII